MVNFIAGFGDKLATAWIRQLVAVDFVANTVDFVASVYGAKAMVRRKHATVHDVTTVPLCVVPVVVPLYAVNCRYLFVAHLVGRIG